MKIYELDIKKIEELFDEITEEFENVETIIAVEQYKNSDYGYSIFIKYKGESQYCNFAEDEFNEEQLKEFIKVKQ